jgi:hypothetical protein
MIWRCILDSLALGDQFNKHHAEEEDVRSVANFVNGSVVYPPNIWRQKEMAAHI